MIGFVAGPGISKVRASTERNSEKRAEAVGRKAEVIALHAKSGLSKREFVRACGAKWETGREYLDAEVPKKCPRPRFVRLARNLVERLEILAEQTPPSRAGVA